MHKGRAKLQLYGVLVAIVVIAATVFTVITRPVQQAAAADISSSYNWKHLKMGGGGWITGIVAHPTTQDLIYARSDVGGLYRWDEGMQTWIGLFTANAVPNPTVSDYNVESVAVSKTNNQVVYAAAGITWDFTNDAPSGRILKSTNRGQTWTDSGQRWKIHGNADYRQQSERLAVDPNNENTVYFGSRNEGLWRSTNGGQNWSQISTSLIPIVYTPGDNKPAGIMFVLFDPTSGTTNGVTKRIYVGDSGSGIYMSNDGGNSWTNIYPTNQVTLSADVASNGNAYFSITDGHLRRYTPSSNSWQDVSPAGNPNYLTVSVDPFDAQRLIVGTSPVSGGRLWRTTNGGGSWDTLNVTLTSTDIPWVTNSDEGNWLSVGNIIFDTQVQDRLWFAQGTGVWRASGLNGSTINWNFVSKGIEEFIGTDLIAPPGGKPVNTTWDRQGFYHADPDQYPQREIMNEKFSSGWDLDYSGQNPQFLVSVISDHRYLNPDYSGYSTNGGQSWTQFSGSGATSDLYAGNIAVSATNTNNIVWLPTYGRLPYVSTDRGASWNKLNFFNGVGGLHIQYYLDQRRALTSDKVDDSFYIYSSDGAFYRSTNSGQDWVKTAGAPQGGGDAWVFGQTNAAPGHAGHVWVSTVQGGLAYTENKGDTWTKVSAVQEAKVFGFGKELPGTAYPAIYAHAKINNQWGIWRSGDKGATWDLLAEYPMGIYDTVKVVNGDMNIAGRVYVALGGNGIVYGDPGGTTPTPGTTVTPTPTTPPSGNVADGRYRLANRNSTLNLDDPSWGVVGTQLTQWQTSGDNQYWDVAATGNGYYKITSNHNNLAVAVQNASTSDGTAVVLQTYNGSDNQLWQFTTTNNGYYKLVNKKSGKLLAVSGDATNEGAPIIQWTGNGQASQEWSFQPTAGVANGRYRLANRNSTLNLDDPSWGVVGTQLTQWQTSGDNQYWYITTVGNGYYKIISNHNSRTVGVQNASTSDGTAVVLQNDTSSDEQLWQLTATDSGYYKIVNKKSGKLLAVTDDGTSNGTPIIQWTSSGHSSQQWKFQSV